MFNTVFCTTHRHNTWLVILALLVCVFAATTAARLIVNAGRASGKARLWLLIVSGLCGGAGVWTTHFIGMLAFEPGVPTAYDPAATLGSLIISLVGGALAVVLTAVSPRRWADLVWGVAFGSSAAAMHYAGMSALRLPGRLSWSPGLVAASVVVGVGFSMAARIVTRRVRTRTGFATSIGLLVLATCGVHFLGMASLIITPDARIAVPANTVSHTSLALGVTALTLLVGFACFASLWFDAHNRRSALKKIEAVIQALPQAVAYFDEGDGYVLGNNAFAREMAGLGLKPQPGLPYLTILGEVAAIDAARSAVAAAPDWIADHLEARRHGPISVDRDLGDGRVLRVESNPTSLGGVVTLLSDITDLKRQTEELAAARDLAEAGNRAKGEFLANMSHELRTPMNGVIGVAELLARESLTPKQAELVGLIQASGSTLDRLLADLLDMARVEAGALEVMDAPFDVAAALSAVIDQFAPAAAEKGLALEIDAPAPAPGWVLGDEVHLKQVLANLIANAVKFTSQGRIDVRIEVLADALVFRVRDTGVGFDVAQKDRLFQRFEQFDNSNTRRFGGAGLGLAVATSLTARMGGSLVCDSTEGVGSIFILVIPYRRANPPTGLETAPDEASVSHAAAPHILIVDDNPVNQRVLSLILEGAGVETQLADDGLQAVAQWRANHFDAILMDIQMPVMDGLTAVRSIRSIETIQGLDPTPIIMVSANAMPEHVAASFDAGANGHVAKPVTAQRLFAALEDLEGGERPPRDRSARAA